MFADAEILKQAGGPRLVRVPAKGMSIKHYLPAGQHAAGECNRRRVQQDDVDCVGPQVMRRGKGRVEPAAIKLGIRGTKMATSMSLRGVSSSRVELPNK